MVSLSLLRCLVFRFHDPSRRRPTRKVFSDELGSFSITIEKALEFIAGLGDGRIIAIVETSTYIAIWYMEDIPY
jgi:hypothetical protein